MSSYTFFHKNIYTIGRIESKFLLMLIQTLRHEVVRGKEVEIHAFLISITGESQWSLPCLRQQEIYIVSIYVSEDVPIQI
jgi:hypothetical protein